MEMTISIAACIYVLCAIGAFILLDDGEWMRRDVAGIAKNLAISIFWPIVFSSLLMTLAIFYLPPTKRNVYFNLLFASVTCLFFCFFLIAIWMMI